MTAPAWGRDPGPGFWYRWHRCKVYVRHGHGWIGWALRYPDRTTDYYKTPQEAVQATRELVDATILERRAGRRS